MTGFHLPLAGVRVLEMVDKAEMCGRYLADLGATVIKVEPPGGGATRREGPFHAGRSLSFAVRNANKDGIELDLRHPSDAHHLWRLLGTVDLLIESHRPGVLDELGFGVARVRERHPSLVVLSITDFGQTGPYRDLVASPWVHTAMCGFLSRSGIGDREPLMPPAALPAEAAALQAAWAAVVGLWAARETGRGDHIDLSILEAAAQIVDPAMGMSGTASAAGDTTSRNRPTVQLYPTFECADGFVRLAVLSPRQWWALRAWLGEPDALMSSELDGIHARFAAAEVIGHYVSAHVRHETVTAVVDEAQARGVPCAPVTEMGDVIAAEHYARRGAIARREIVPGVTAAVPTGFVEYDGARLGIRRRAPEVGEHTAAVLAGRDGPAGRPLPMTPRPGRRHPLAGVSVLDLGVIVYGAEVSRMFADMGADVLKIENRAHPDGARVARGGGLYPSFVAGQRSKRSVGLNLRSPAGRSLFLRLVEQSDLVLSNFKPGTLESLGLTYDVMAGVNPAIVMVTSSAMGSRGPWSGWMGYGPLIRCATGLTSLWRYPEHPGSFADLTTVYPDHYAARVMATAGLAALLGRRRAGRGGHVEAAQAESILVQLSELVALESLEPGSVKAPGNVTVDGVPCGVYRCRGDDEWCVITVRTDDEWAAFCRATELDHFASDPSVATAAGRAARRDEIEAGVRRWTAARSPLEVQTTLQAAGVPAGAMQRGAELITDPQLVARGAFTELLQPGLGAISVENHPFLSEDIAAPLHRPAAELGEHTREVMSEILGLGSDEIDRLLFDGVLEEHVPVSVS